MSCLWTLPGPPLLGACKGQGQGPFHRLSCVSWQNYLSDSRLEHNKSIHQPVLSLLMFNSWCQVPSNRGKIYKDMYYGFMSNWTSRNSSSTLLPTHVNESTGRPCFTFDPNSTGRNGSWDSGMVVLGRPLSSQVMLALAIGRSSEAPI